MNAERFLIHNGCARVVNAKTDEVLGFVLTESTPMSDQLQRWILRKEAAAAKLPPFKLLPWPTPSLVTWQSWVSTEPANPASWGQSPDDGLWLPDGVLYVVAQSTGLAIDASTSLSQLQPVYPREEAVKLHTQLVARAPAGARSPSEGSLTTGVSPARAAHPAQGPAGSNLVIASKPQAQAGIGDYSIYQNLVFRGRVFGDGSLARPEGTGYWTTSERWVLYPGYQRAGGEGLETTVIKDEASFDDEKLDDFLAHVKTDIEGFTDLCAYEVTGCNNYQGQSPPNAEWFI